MPVIAILRSLKQEDFEFGPKLAVEQLLCPFRLHLEVLHQTLKLRTHKHTHTHTHTHTNKFRVVVVALGRVLAYPSVHETSGSIPSFNQEWQL